MLSAVYTSTFAKDLHRMRGHDVRIVFFVRDAADLMNITLSRLIDALRSMGKLQRIIHIAYHIRAPGSFGDEVNAAVRSLQQCNSPPTLQLVAEECFIRRNNERVMQLYVYKRLCFALKN